MSKGSGAKAAAEKLLAAMVPALKAVSACVIHARDTQAEMKAADDVVDVMQMVARMVLALEALTDASEAASKVGRAALAEAFETTGVPAVRLESHDVTLVAAKRKALIQNPSSLPETYWTQPPLPPRKLNEAAVLKALIAQDPLVTPHATISNGGAPHIAFNKRN